MVRRAGAVTAAGLAVLGVTACQAPAPGTAPRGPPATASRAPASATPAPAGATPAPAGATPAPARPAGNPPGTWRLAFHDTFGGRALHTALWSTGWLAHGITPPVSPRELECYDPANVTVSGGALHLTLIRQPHSCGGKSRPYTSGMVNTEGKFQFTYGFLQARIWLPGQDGQITDWPAFWADGQHWPKDGEIDVLEGLGGKACWHFVNPATVRGGCAAGTFYNGWHTFGGPALHPALWSTGWLAHGVTPPVSPQELECYDPANVTVSGGALHLSLIQHPHSCGGKARPYSSGMVNTDGKFQFTYGFMEARIWLPGKGGQITDWPAFWADGQHWPKDGEIDVLEGLGGRACWHFINRDAVRGGCAAGTFYNGWHTFGADWEPRSITYYYDGRVVGTIKSGITHAPMYLILNNATAHLYQIPVQVPADMRVAYVRVWQHPQQ